MVFTFNFNITDKMVCSLSLAFSFKMYHYGQNGMRFVVKVLLTLGVYYR